MASYRMLRVNEGIKQAISLFLIREIDDPRIRNNLVTITKVETSRDLKNAKVYFVCLDTEQVATVLEGLVAAKGILFSLLKNKLAIRYIPDLKFFYDKSLLETNRVLEEIRNIEIANSKLHAEHNVIDSKDIGTGLYEEN